MPAVRVMILRAAGTNCDYETVHAWELAGAAPERVHVRRLIEQPQLLDAYQILTIPGGFSYGDDIAAGRVFAAQLERHLRDRLIAFVDSGKLIFGICNGLQVLVKAGLLPDLVRTGAWADAATCSVTYNEPAGFQDRWVRLRAADNTPCVFLEPGREYEMPIAHGEGRVVFRDDSVRRRVDRAGLNAIRYVAVNQMPAAPAQQDEPANPNGSELDCAGLCDPTGRIFGLMPHPDRHVVDTQHPCWTSRDATVRDGKGDGLAMFERAVEAVR
jgi:phosphoribosylformylglycinamidine synthase subunit PurQ / glutaminase